MRYLKLILPALLLVPASLMAQGSKVGIVDFDRIIAQSAEGKAASSEFQTFLQERSAALQQVQQQLTDAQNRLETQQLALSSTALADLNKEIRDLTTRLQREQEDAQRAAEEKQQELILPVYEKANQIVQQYAADQAYSLILDSSNPQAGIVFASDVTDITTEIIRRMDSGQEEAATQP